MGKEKGRPFGEGLCSPSAGYRHSYAVPTAQKEKTVTPEPQKENVQQYLQGIDYPASKDELFSTAESNDAPDNFFKRLAELPIREYSGPEDVVQAIDGLRRPELWPDG